MSVPDYVLGRFRPEEKAFTEDAVKKSAEACSAWLEKPFLQVMNEYNQ
jgi:PTH1 family peptidyl-tRNA hydrolase